MIRAWKVAAVAAASICAVSACGSSHSSSTHSGTPSSSSSAAPASVSPASAAAFRTAFTTFENAYDISSGSVSVAVDQKDFAAFKKHLADVRTVFYNFDSAVRQIAIPNSLAVERNNLLDGTGAVITELDALQQTTSQAQADSEASKLTGPEASTKSAVEKFNDSLGLPSITKAPEQGAAVYTDDFSNPKSGWQTGPASNGDVYQGGQLVFGLPAGNYAVSGVSTSHTFDSSHVSLGVEETASSPSAQVGIVCPGGSDGSYAAAVSPAGDWTIQFFQDQKQLDLNDGKTTAMHASAPNQLRLDCQNVTGGADVALYANGTLVGRGGWTTPIPSQNEGGLLVINTSSAAVTASFDNWSVSELGNSGSATQTALHPPYLQGTDITDAKAWVADLLKIAPKAYDKADTSSQSNGIVEAWRAAFPTVLTDNALAGLAETAPKSGISGIDIITDKKSGDDVLPFAVQDSKGGCAGGVVWIPESGPITTSTYAITGACDGNSVINAAGIL